MKTLKTLSDSASNDPWAGFSEGYLDKVFVTVQFERVRRRILDAVLPGRVLDMGCGPTPLLLNELARTPGVNAYGSDFSALMIRAAVRHVRTGSVRFVIGDNRCLPFASESFSTVISVNSILPEERRDVAPMISEALRVLRPGGRFVALLPAFETSLMAYEAWGLKVRYDTADHREYDTTGWQCFHTADDIREMMRTHRVSQYKLADICFDFPEAIAAIRRTYGMQISEQSLRDRPLYEHFLIAHKPDHARNSR